MTTHQTLLVIAHYYSKPGIADRVASLLSELAIHSRQEMKNLSWEFFRSTENPNHFVIIEHYSTTDGLEIHRNTVHYQKIAVGEIIPLLSERSVQTFMIAQNT